jgi:hypothetical protein
MRSATTALAWEFWSANRRGWLLLAAAVPVCALLYRVLAARLRESPELQSFCVLPMVISLAVAAAFCNFTDRMRREDIAGFPRHLFVLPVTTVRLVSCAIACGVFSVLALYVAWVKLVLEPVEIVLLVRWPVTLLAAFVVFYQAIIWCLCGFRLTRIISLSLVATTLVGIGVLPTLGPGATIWASEAGLSAVLLVLVAATYGVTLVWVDTQRRGGGRGWAWPRALVERVLSAIPHRQRALTSVDSALFWLEWRRAGLILPAAVLLATCLMLGAVVSFTDRGEKATIWAETWLVVLPLVMAFPVSLGFGKPDFWSLDLALPPFIATRPISGGQLLAAKMKVAAASTLLAWAALLIIAPLCLYLFCDTEHWRGIWRIWGIIYSPFSQWAIPILGLVMAMLLTWGLVIGNIWLGFAGRPGFYYSLVVLGTAAFLTALILYAWCLDRPSDWEDTGVRALGWLPWVLATCAAAKIWFALWCARRLRSRTLVSNRNIAAYLSIWLAATACLVFRAWLVSPGIEWLRNMLMLLALCVVPVARVAAAPLAIAWNRHR